MAVRQYIGARYVPRFFGLHSIETAYEPLSIVNDAVGNSYTSKKFVPIGTALSNSEFWALSGTTSGAISMLEARIEEEAHTRLNDDIEIRESIDSTNETVEGLLTNIANLYGQLVNVKDYGAVGDGVVDDTAAIKAAIEAAERGIYFPAGDYVISETLVIEKQSFLVLGVPIGEYHPCIYPTHTTFTVFDVRDGGFRINNIIIRDSQTSLISPPVVNGITFVNCGENVDAIINNCDFHNLATAITMEGKNCTIKGGMISQCHIGVLALYNSFKEQRDIIVDGVRFHSCGYFTTWDDESACVKYLYDSNVQNNQANLISTIRNCFVDYCSPLLMGMAYNVIVTNNVCWGMHNHFVTVRGKEGLPNPRTGYIDIRDNYFSGYNAADTPDNRIIRSGIKCEMMQYVNIVNNSIIGCYSEAVELVDDCSNTNIIGNRIRQTPFRATGNFTYFNFGNRSSTVTLDNNFVRQTSDSGTITAYASINKVAGSGGIIFGRNWMPARDNRINKDANFNTYVAFENPARPT